jgi:hypothetical protein
MVLALALVLALVVALAVALAVAFASVFVLALVGPFAAVACRRLKAPAEVRSPWRRSVGARETVARSL